MATNTLNNRSAGDIILASFWNDIHTALEGDLVGRDTSGVPAAGQNIGTAAFPWGPIRASSLILGGSAIDTTQIQSPVNRIISGKTRSGSNQPAFIVPTGSANSFTVKGVGTSLVFDVNGVAVTVSADLVKGSLAVAPSSNNTALVNDAEAAGQADTRLWGENGHRKVITMDTVGSNITALVGTWATFKMNGEFFYGYVSSTTQISKCFRGFFTDPSGNPVNRTPFSDNDTIQLMHTAWIFIQSDATTVDVTYRAPIWSFASPLSPLTGDYWYDLGNNLWKRYDGASFQIIDRTFVGMAIVDTANCVAARCQHFYAAFREDHDVEFDVQSTSILESADGYGKINVYGKQIDFGQSLMTWNITTQLATASDMYTPTATASTLYYLYLKDDGNTVISDISPYFRSDFLGWYHPHNPWRCVASAYYDASSEFHSVGSYGKIQNERISLHTGAGPGAVWTATMRYVNVNTLYGSGLLHLDDANNGTTFVCTRPGKYSFSAGYNMTNGSEISLGLSVPDAFKTNPPDSIPKNTRYAYYEQDSGVSGFGTVTQTLDLKIGDVVRILSSTGSAPSNEQSMSVVKVG